MSNARIAWLFVVGALLLSVPAVGQSRPSDADLANALRAGGHVIVMRHGATFSDQADTDPLNPDNIAKQRQLNAKGEEAARAFGQASSRSACRWARSSRASSTVPTRP